MTIHVNNNSTWAHAKEVYVNNGAWTEAKEVYVNNAGVWSLMHKVVTLTTDTANLNLFTLAGNPTSPITLKLVIPAGIYVYSTSTLTAALSTGTFPAGSNIYIINNGFILGKGGDGGVGGRYALYNNLGVLIRPASSATAGGPGGNAININLNVTIMNNGIIGGGGGGGGGGGADSIGTPGNGGSGGGGAGRNVGVGGVLLDTYSGANGTLTTGGNGGPQTGGAAAAGAKGGDLGQNGGTPGTGNIGAPGAGGAAGKAVNLNGNVVTWDAVGTRYGLIS